MNGLLTQAATVYLIMVFALMAGFAQTERRLGTRDYKRAVLYACVWPVSGAWMFYKNHIEAA